MKIQDINTSINYKQNSQKKDKYAAGGIWFALDLGTATLSDTYYRTKRNIKTPKQDILKQTAKNSLWAAMFALVFAPLLGKFYQDAKNNNLINKDDKNSIAGLALLSVATAFRLFVASRPHPKWKGAFSKFGNKFL